ncbi:restriction endonuclease subunit S [Comamonas aquatica]|uniref:restriction endonuclease subunit S n=1 Tax=Comamonas aquatica TaxID=225991 RepID=UPI001EF2850A|nr:restriction endonuclease subunit S [Comamonas aquatica]CAB5693697.1 Type I restriction enzyme EcoKI specificity protein [Comamonas aquatica]
MELKPGYKHTEVGAIPSDWKVAPLGQLSSIERGKFSARPRNDPRLYGGNTPFIQTGDVTRSNGAISAFTQTLNSEGLKVSRVFPKGTLFFTIAANIGDVGISQFEAACPDSLVAITPHAPTDKYWLLHELSRRKVDFENLASPGAQLNINLEKLRPYFIPIPPANEQRSIAEALGDANALIESLDQLITKKRQIKQGAMQELLTGKRRLPGFSGEWEAKRLGDVGNCLRGVTYNGDSDLWPHDTTHTKRLLRSNNVQNSAVVIDGIQFVNSARVKSEQLLKPHDVLICMANGSKALVGKAGFFNVADGHEYTFGAFMGCFRTESTVSNPAFVFYLFQTARYRDYINNLLAGSSINNLNPGSIESLEFRLPQMSEQTAIATVLSDMDTELTALETRLAKARQIKQGMMQELLTGRIRLL